MLARKARGGAGIDLVETCGSCSDIQVNDHAVPLPPKPQGSRATAVGRVDTTILW
jgi:hypothetical protein